MGWSLGANILTNFLGEEGENAKLAGAVAMCNPFDLNACDAALQNGFFGTVYSRAMAKNMRALFAPHEHLFQGLPNYDNVLVANAKTVRDFDEAVTRVTFGFDSVDAYYDVQLEAIHRQRRRASSRGSGEGRPHRRLGRGTPGRYQRKDDARVVVLVETESGGHSVDRGIGGAVRVSVAGCGRDAILRGVQTRVGLTDIGNQSDGQSAGRVDEADGNADVERRRPRWTRTWRWSARAVTTVKRKV